MKIFYADTVPLNLPPGHRFPAEKYVLLREKVFSAGIVPPDQLIPAQPVDLDVLALAHSPEYIQKVLTGTLNAAEIRRVGLPWSVELVDRSLRAVGATIGAARAALADGLAAYLGGGTHHAYHDHGEGFCVFNDVAVAIRAIQSTGEARRVLVVDCDVHHGNGTAAILGNDPDVFLLDLYGEKNYPYHKEPVALAIPLPDGTTDELYLAALSNGLRQALDSFRAEFVFYLAEADAYEDDRLGRLKLTLPGMAARDRLVFGACRTAGLPIAIVLSGGYAREIQDTVKIHFQTIQIAAHSTT